MRHLIEVRGGNDDENGLVPLVMVISDDNGLVSAKP